MVLIGLNFFEIFFKCFMRTLSIVTGEPGQDKDLLDLAHKFRFFLFSVMDVLNGLSILYCFHCMHATHRRSHTPRKEYAHSNTVNTERLKSLLLRQSNQRPSGETVLPHK